MSASTETKASPLPATAKPAMPSSPVPHSIHTLIAAAGLPSDRLSASIVSFARFFSLPIKPELMAAIRQQVFSQPMPTPTPTAQTAMPMSDTAPEALGRIREALSLAAAAAEGKGVELTQKGLGVYAEAITPDWQKRQGSGEQERRQRRQQDEGDEREGGSKTDPISADELRKQVLESAGKDPLLAILNRLPCKDGRHWIVLPFGFDMDGREFRVSMRILLDNGNLTANQSGRMLLDITESSEADRRWLFTLESANGAITRLTAYLAPELPSMAVDSFTKDLSGLVGIPVECVSVKGRMDDFPCESSDCPDNLLRAVYETV